MASWRTEPKVGAWRAALARAGCTVRSLRARSVVKRHNGEMLFGMLSADITAPDGSSVPPVVVVRGDAVVVVPLLRNRANGQERFLVVHQYRVGNGLLNCEFPAGMLDRAVKDPLGVAVKELREETGLKVSRAQLSALYPRPLHTSVGLLDEAIWFFGGIFEVDDRRYRAFEGAAAGAADEHEHVTTSLATAREIEQHALSMPVVLGLRLFQSWRNQDRARTRGNRKTPNKGR
jgi:8-oxo-dGTP pyrophosphatase MutT (NUDIX family)